MNLPNWLRSTRAYWIVTALMGLFMASGALFDVANTADAVRLITGLGYPGYLVRFLGALKLAGIAAIVIGRFPRLKQWAYAGLVFDTGGALYSHYSVGSATKDWIPALLGLMLVGASYGLYTLMGGPIETGEPVVS
jgi:DoxX-like family